MHDTQWMDPLLFVYLISNMTPNLLFIIVAATTALLMYNHVVPIQTHLLSCDFVYEHNNNILVFGLMFTLLVICVTGQPQSQNEFELSPRSSRQATGSDVTGIGWRRGERG